MEVDQIESVGTPINYCKKNFLTLCSSNEILRYYCKGSKNTRGQSSKYTDAQSFQCLENMNLTDSFIFIPMVTKNYLLCLSGRFLSRQGVKNR